MPPNSVSQTLTSAAFGAEPGYWPLPAAGSPVERWLRAVAAGGQGYYGSAHSELAALRREVRDVDGRALLSLAHSTQGSLLRQLGWHGLARGWDGRAVLLAGSDVEARVDALIGLAADALGLGRFAASATLLDRARAALSDNSGASDPPARLGIRVQWVSAELAMATGDGVTALRHAERSVELAAAAADGSVRHQVKSSVVLAAALCCSSRLKEARAVADSALEATEQWGLVPLRWALASLLDGIGSDTHPGPDVLAIRGEAAHVVRVRGGSWCDS